MKLQGRTVAPVEEVSLVVSAVLVVVISWVLASVGLLVPPPPLPLLSPVPGSVALVSLVAMPGPHAVMMKRAARLSPRIARGR